MSNDPLDYDAIRRRVDERMNKRKEFIAHLSAYVLTNIAIWITYFLISPPGLWVLIPILVTFGWGIGIVIHGSLTFFEAGGMDSMHARMMRQEVNRERLARGLPPIDEDASEKPKRDRIMRLSDDGELVEDEEKSRQRSRK
jgi:hypothetical protein